LTNWNEKELTNSQKEILTCNGLMYSLAFSPLQKIFAYIVGVVLCWRI